MSVIGVDVDGIVANFEKGYAPLLTQVSGIEFPLLGQPGWPDTWFWERAAGVTKEQEDKVWKEMIIPSSTFWLNLPAHKGATEFLISLRDLADTNHDVYFITSRVGKRVKEQTEEWLMAQGWSPRWAEEPKVPTVLISSEKGACCKALKITHYIDDRNENCADVLTVSPKTLCYMLAASYNSLEALGVSGNIIRIDTLQEFLDGIKG